MSISDIHTWTSTFHSLRGTFIRLLICHIRKHEKKRTSRARITSHKLALKKVRKKPPIKEDEEASERIILKIPKEKRKTYLS
jgi:hypothetical protein